MFDGYRGNKLFRIFSIELDQKVFHATVIFHFFCSVLGHRIPDLPVPLFNVYPASKFALTAIAQTIRQELAYQKANIKLTVRIISTNLMAFSVCLFVRIQITNQSNRSKEEKKQHFNGALLLWYFLSVKWFQVVNCMLFFC